MKNIIVTSGFKYTDIDVLACAVSYNELLTKEGKNSSAVISNIFNKSVTKVVKSWPYKFETKLSNNNNSFVIVDISNPDHIADFVEQEKIVEIYDHHFGFENYWKEKLGVNAKIEKVGACATLIWEEYKNRNLSKSVSIVNANLLYTAIVSNTLSLKASVTSQRDVDALNELKEIVDLPDNWIEIYFRDQEKAVLLNPVKEIINDTHIENFPNSTETLIIGQVELWDSRIFINKHLNDIKKAMNGFNTTNWFLTSPSIGEGINYIYTEDDNIKELLQEKIEAKFEGNFGKTDKLWLRKEIKKKIYEF